MLLSIILCGIIALLVIMHYFERKDLYNRLMSKNLSEYKRFSHYSVPESRETAHEKAIKKWRNGRSD